jgi:hypothetical protein
VVDVRESELVRDPRVVPVGRERTR